MNLTSPIIVKLKSNPDLGEGIWVGTETYMDVAKNEDGSIKRDANEQPVLEKRRDCYVYWPADRSQMFVHQLHELEPQEVVAARTLDEMKREVTEDVMANLETEVAEIVNDILSEDEDEGTGEGEPEQGDGSRPE